MVRRPKQTSNQSDSDIDAEQTLSIDHARWSGFRDGVGERENGVDEQGFSVELLRLRKELSPYALPLTDRILRLIDFDRPGAARALRVDQDENSPRLILVSERAPGFRLSELLERGAERGVIPDLGAALYLIRRLLTTAASIQRATGIDHLAVAPERILITPRGSVVIAEAALAGAFESFSDRMPQAVRRAFRLQRAEAKISGAHVDIARMTIAGMAMIVGRPIDPLEDIDPLSPVVQDVIEVAAVRAGDQLAAALTPWLDHAISADPLLAFANFSDALADLVEIVPPPEARCPISRIALRKFMDDLSLDRGHLEGLEEDRLREIRARQARRGPVWELDRPAAGSEAAALDGVEDPVAAIMEMPVAVEDLSSEIFKQPVLIDDQPSAMAAVIEQAAPAVDEDIAGTDLAGFTEADGVASPLIADGEALTGWREPLEAGGDPLVADDGPRFADDEPLVGESPLIEQSDPLISDDESLDGGRSLDDLVDEILRRGVEPDLPELSESDELLHESAMVPDVVDATPYYGLGETPPYALEETPPYAPEEALHHAAEETPHYAHYAEESQQFSHSVVFDEPLPEPPVDEPPAEEPPVDEPATHEPPAEEPPPHESPVEDPPVEEPPGEAEEPPPIWMRAAIEQVAHSRQTRPPAPLPRRPEHLGPVFELPDDSEREREPETTTLSDIAKELGLTLPVSENAPAPRPWTEPGVETDAVQAPAEEEGEAEEAGWDTDIRKTLFAPEPAPEPVAPPVVPARPVFEPPPPIFAPAPSVEAAEAFTPLPSPVTLEPPPAVQAMSVRADVDETPAPEPSARRSIADRAADIRESSGRFLKVAATLVLVVGGIAAAGYGGWRYYSSLSTPGTLLVESTPPGTQVEVDGKQRGTTPVTLDLPAGKHEVALTRRGMTRRFEVAVRAGEQTTQTLDWSNVRETGSLAVTTDPAGAKVSVDGRAYGVTPLTIPDLPAGRRRVVLEGQGGTVRREVTIVADGTAMMSEAIFSGFLAVFAPVELQIYEGNRLLGTTENSRIMIPAGRHELTLVNRELGSRLTRTVEVEPGQVAAINITEVPAVVQPAAAQPVEAPPAEPPQ